MRDLVCALQRLAPSVLLGLESLDALTCSEWGRDAATPTRTLKVSLALPQHDAARRGGLVRDGAWRKTTLSSFFGAAGLGGVVPSGMGAKHEALYVVDVTTVLRPLTASPSVATNGARTGARSPTAAAASAAAPPSSAASAASASPTIATPDAASAAAASAAAVPLLLQAAGPPLAHVTYISPLAHVATVESTVIAEPSPPAGQPPPPPNAEEGGAAEEEGTEEDNDHQVTLPLPLTSTPNPYP